MGPSLQEVYDRLRDVRQGGCWETEPPEGLQFCDFLLEILDPRRGWLGFEMLKRGDRLILVHHQKLIEECGRIRESRRHTRVQVVKKSMQGRTDYPTQLLLGREFNLIRAKACIGMFQQLGFRRGIGSSLAL